MGLARRDRESFVNFKIILYVQRVINLILFDVEIQLF